MFCWRWWQPAVLSVVEVKEFRGDVAVHQGVATFPLGAAHIGPPDGCAARHHVSLRIVKSHLGELRDWRRLPDAGNDELEVTKGRGIDARDAGGGPHGQQELHEGRWHHRPGARGSARFPPRRKLRRQGIAKRVRHTTENLGTSFQTPPSSPLPPPVLVFETSPHRRVYTTSAVE